MALRLKSNAIGPPLLSFFVRGMRDVKVFLVCLGFLVAFGFGFWAGTLVGGARTRAAVLAGPLSDNYDPALTAIQSARTKLNSGDTNLFEHLDEAEAQIRNAQNWAKDFIGEQAGAANRSQPIRSQTNGTSVAAGSGR